MGGKSRSSQTPPAKRRYRLTGMVLCHDLRMNSEVEVIEEFDKEPTLEEATKLLWQAGGKMVAAGYCEGCPFELSAVRITEEAD
ncbi:hypothetical protein [Zavarzinella formosa]|uniref:hypothetical protein n=1 Tax=Zavarzinella formosa TaxID=360055 RepID=UPI0003034D6C|nr:hypothetical protein [Zavarzinella formosa]